MATGRFTYSEGDRIKLECHTSLGTDVHRGTVLTALPNDLFIRWDDGEKEWYHFPLTHPEKNEFSPA